jgi:hypothetical protein
VRISEAVSVFSTTSNHYHLMGSNFLSNRVL